ncbi:hypothetical protein PSI15_11040 [Xenorhabdus sp. PR6a]|uniref:hypothetical protein n=1 Tax=Xenorhabdus sp. PR6a TaxID=3025877 RepID=UPI002359B4C1|nr:hypothetical protein [Xenorhabdus sp. PR6a]MDC9582093.1 hypothetical protein [Xenorhabdus sp. PR6a]
MNDFFAFHQIYYRTSLEKNKIINNCSFKTGCGFCSGISLYLFKKIINETCKCIPSSSPHHCDYLAGERSFKFPSLREVFDIAKKHSEIIYNRGLNALSREYFQFNINMIFLQKKTCGNCLPGYVFEENLHPDEGCALVLLGVMDYKKTQTIHMGSLFHNNYNELMSSPDRESVNHVGFAFWNKESLFVFDPNTGGKLEGITKFTIEKIEIAINSMYFRINSPARIRILLYYFPDFSDDNMKYVNNIIEQM